MSDSRLFFFGLPFVLFRTPVQPASDSSPTGFGLQSNRLWTPVQSKSDSSPNSIGKQSNQHRNTFQEESDCCESGVGRNFTRQSGLRMHRIQGSRQPLPVSGLFVPLPVLWDSTGDCLFGIHRRKYGQTGGTART